MEKRTLGKTDMDLTVLSFGASSLGAEFRGIDLDEALRSVRVAIDLGINFIDTSPVLRARDERDVAGPRAAGYFSR